MKRKKEKRGEKGGGGINKGKNYDKIWYLKGGGKIYFPPICTVPTWGKKYFERVGGEEEYNFLGKYIPLSPDPGFNWLVRGESIKQKLSEMVKKKWVVMTLKSFWPILQFPSKMHVFLVLTP